MLCTKGSENVAKLEQGKTNYANYAMHKMETKNSEVQINLNYKVVLQKSSGCKQIPSWTTK
jgi:hypothetical protein